MPFVKRLAGEGEVARGGEHFRRSHDALLRCKAARRRAKCGDESEPGDEVLHDATRYPHFCAEWPTAIWKLLALHSRRDDTARPRSTSAPASTSGPLE